MINSKKGCLLEALRLNKVDVILHVVNCQGVMGAGFAAALRSSYPVVYKEYLSLEEYSMGSVQVVKVDERRTVCNLFAQNYYGRERRHLDYVALRECLSKVQLIFQEKSVKIGIPYQMGCGLAGGNWEFVSKMINCHLSDLDVTIYKLGG